MQAISILNTPTLIAAAGNRDFVHIYNNSDAIVYVCYDGDHVSSGVNGAKLTTSTGVPIPIGGFIFLDNNGSRNLFNKAVYGIAAVTGKEVRVQGV